MEPADFVRLRDRHQLVADAFNEKYRVKTQGESG
jgi:hypothetical protein